MKIVSIFEDRLFALHYQHEAYNEYDRLMNLWTEVSYLKDYAERNKEADVYGFISQILNDAEQIQDFIERLTQMKEPYGFYFEPLQYSEQTKLLAFQKGKIKQNRLRYYAIKLDDNCYLITGGAIKMTQKMSDHPDTTKELNKLKIARAYLNKHDVFDQDSFYELINE